jgi:MFS family permease
VLFRSFGERQAMVYSAAIALGAEVFAIFARSVILLIAALFCVGMSTATFYLCRQAYITEAVPITLRARALSTLAGSHRIGMFLGPFAGALAITLLGLHGAFWVAVAASGLTILVLHSVPDLPGTGAVADRAGARDPVSLGQTLRGHWRLLSTLGLALLMLSATRASRQTVLPLWAAHLGLSAAHTSLVFGVASAVEMSLFYPAGKLMDRAGRLAVIVPVTLLLGGAMMALPLAGHATGFIALAMLMSAGNGIGSGVAMTLGADVAPQNGKLAFLSAWRLMSDTGSAVGPVVVSAVAAAATLAAGIVAVGALAPLACLGMLRFVPRYSPYAWGMRGKSLV